ncbi:unnamed protein product [Orchesella dallaii]|uniref:Uncharacterized protein n=1 Tax=Orchesella dallaii TaxID=48710 RepID=A0ABP1PXY1_9HEXA
MLGWSGGTFITLERFAFVFNLILLSLMGGTYDEYGLRYFGFTVDVFQMLLSLIFLGCMASYCVDIILCILKLREDDTGSEFTFGEFDDAAPIPVATNLSRSSTAHSTYSVHHNNKNSNPQLSQTASHGHLSQCNSQYHIGQNQISGTHKSPLLQERRLLPKVNPSSQDRLNEIHPPLDLIIPHIIKVQVPMSQTQGLCTPIIKAEGFRTDRLRHFLIHIITTVKNAFYWWSWRGNSWSNSIAVTPTPPLVLVDLSKKSKDSITSASRLRPPFRRTVEKMKEDYGVPNSAEDDTDSIAVTPTPPIVLVLTKTSRGTWRGRPSRAKKPRKPSHTVEDNDEGDQNSKLANVRK